MLDLFQISAEAIGATVRRFPTVQDAGVALRELAGNGRISASPLPAEIAAACADLSFAGADEHADCRLCVSFARAGVAATGSLLLELADPAGRGATALPLIHAVFVKESTIVPVLRALHGLLDAALAQGGSNYLSLTTGPSRTADIERVLTIGVHGPKELHIFVLEGA